MTAALKRSELANVSGQYFAGSKRVVTKNKFNTEQNRRLLWDLSLHALRSAVASPALQAG